MALSGKLLRGTRLSMGFTSTAHDLQTTPFTVIASGPTNTASSALRRIVWRWRPSGSSDSQFTWVGGTTGLVWTLTSGWTATGFEVGQWVLRFVVGDPATTQDNMTKYTLTVYDDPAGVLPVT